MSSQFLKNPCLTQDQLFQLVTLIKEKEDILFRKKTDPRLPSNKPQCWQEICELLNASNLEQNPRSVKQIKRTWEYVRRRVKELELARLREKEAPGGGSPTPLFSAPHLQLARSILTSDIAGGSTETQLSTNCEVVDTTSDSSTSCPSLSSATLPSLSSNTLPHPHQSLPPSSDAFFAPSFPLTPSPTYPSSPYSIATPSPTHPFPTSASSPSSSRPDSLPHRSAKRKRRRLSEEEPYTDLKRRQEELHLLRLEAAREDILAIKEKKNAFAALQRAAESIERAATNIDNVFQEISGSVKTLTGSLQDLIQEGKSAPATFGFHQYELREKLRRERESPK